MLSGVVIGLTRQKGRTYVLFAYCPHYPKHGPGEECSRPDICCVYTDEIKQHGGERVEIQIGDSFSLQSGHCYWTPRAKTDDNPGNRGGVDYDIKL